MKYFFFLSTTISQNLSYAEKKTFLSYVTILLHASHNFGLFRKSFLWKKVVFKNPETFRYLKLFNYSNYSLTF